MSHAYRAQTLDRRLYGVCTGLVEDNEDPEHEGRVKVRFPWLDDATISDWCRVVQPYAGDSFGALWIPEKRSEVLVAFTHGDMNEPVVIGGLYNGKDKPPSYKDGANQDTKMFLTKGGHSITLDDSAQAMSIQILTAGGNEILLDDQNTALTIQTPLGHQIVLDESASKIEVSAIGGIGKITIEASGTITVQGTQIKLSGTSISLAASQLSLG